MDEDLLMAALTSLREQPGGEWGYVSYIPGDPTSVCWFRDAANAAAWLASQSPERLGTKYEYVAEPAKNPFGIAGL